ncbi:unnamed protein product [Lymnaea stagnalis]|uniref:Uncharacterized protein n=1 Tax=Lymnaea stagnalis TaxID=6523 RepID=A0AAV2HVC2_LYMST
MSDNKASNWNTVLVFLCVFLLGLTMSLAVVVHFYRSKLQKFRRRPSRISQRLKFLTRNRHSPRIAENTIPYEPKSCDIRRNNGVYENTSQQNQYVNNGVKTFYVEPEPANNIYNNVHPIDYGRYMNEDGLVYVTVHNSEQVIPPKAITRNQRRKVSYTEIDHNKGDKGETTSGDTTGEGEDELIYHNINGVF